MSEGNIFYYDMALLNTGTYPIVAQISDQRSGTILENPQEWEMSVVRFDLSSDLIPIFFPIITTSPQSNQSVTLRYLNNDFRQYVQATSNEIKEGVFDFQIWLNHVNDALQLAFTALKAAFPAAAPTLPPLLFLNPQTSLISLYTQDTYLDTNPARIQIGVNQPLQQILDFPCNRGLMFPSLNGFDCEIAINQSASLLPVAPRATYPIALSALAGTWIQTSQEFRSLDEWSQIKSIAFQSQLLPIVKEYVPSSVDQYQNDNISSSSFPIVTDFLVAKDGVEPTRHHYTYLPTAEYRMISLVGNKPISRVDMGATYQTDDGVIRPVMIAPNKGMNLKLVFRRINKI